tara:strand:- start:100 stop:1125 length:1026 start_codon:yes stop_codon:yes gene_type:complete
MCKSIISTILFLGLLSVLPVNADSIALRNDTPDRHIVVPGDTLWSISSRFLRDPWLWPKVWGLNREQLKNPHKIYPGDIVILEETPHGVRLQLATEKGTIKLSPRIRTKKSSVTAIPSIPAAAIEPFLSQPLVIDKDGMENTPFILGSSDNRVILSPGTTVYADGLSESEGVAWQIFRPGKALKDPDNDDQILGYEATYLGNTKVEVFADISTMTITRSVQEILKGDRLVPSPGIIFNNYAPHAPDLSISGRIISVYGGVTEFGKGAIVTLNKGAKDGLEMGNVLAVYRKSHVKSPEGEIVQLPDERTGLVFVFRVFDQVAYALVMRSTQSIKIFDAVKTP